MSIDLVTFEAYKNKSGELNKDEFEAVKRYVCSEDEYHNASAYIRETATNLGLGQLPHETEVNIAAKLMGTLKDRIPQEWEDDRPYRLWLFTETHLLQGKDPIKILESGLGGRFTFF